MKELKMVFVQRIGCFLCLLFSLSKISHGVEFFPAPPRADDPGLFVQHLNVSTSRQEYIPLILTTVSSPVGFLHVLPSTPEGCTKRVLTSDIASAAGCYYAVNGGPFDMNTGECEGDIVSNGTVFQIDDVSGFASWGLTQDGRWVFGDVGSETVESEEVVELISGFIGGLLVEGGVGVESTSSLVAPRTAVGINGQGELLLLTVDGAESRGRGMNLTELGVAFADLGATTALNLDGGGSTAAWMDGQLVDRPTCSDHIIPECERQVASIVCIMPPSD